MSEMVWNVETIIKIVLGTGGFLNYAEKKKFVGYIAALFICSECCHGDQEAFFFFLRGTWDKRLGGLQRQE